MKLTIIKNGLTINPSDYGLTCLEFQKQSVSHNHFTETIDQRDGVIHTGTSFGARELQATFIQRAETRLSRQLLIDEFYVLMATKEPIYIIDSRQPSKRWEVLVNSVYEPQYLGSKYSKFEVSFLSPSPYCQSVGTTLDDFTFASDLWQVGMSLPSNQTLKYKHDSNRFQIYNAGVPIDPRKLPLRITYTGETIGDLNIKNLTTNQTFTLYDRNLSADVVLLDGIHHYKNNVNVFSLTNHKFISLATGINEFEVTGTNSAFEIVFDFRFYYL